MKILIKLIKYSCGLLSSLAFLCLFFSSTAQSATLEGRLEHLNHLIRIYSTSERLPELKREENQKTFVGLINKVFDPENKNDLESIVRDKPELYREKLNQLNKMRDELSALALIKKVDPRLSDSLDQTIQSLGDSLSVSAQGKKPLRDQKGRRTHNRGGFTLPLLALLLQAQVAAASGLEQVPCTEPVPHTIAVVEACRMFARPDRITVINSCITNPIQKDSLEHSCPNLLSFLKTSGCLVVKSAGNMNQGMKPSRFYSDRDISDALLHVGALDVRGQTASYSEPYSATHATVTLSPTATGVTTTPNNTALSIVAGSYHSCAIVSGGVQCWGANSFGQLGNNSTLPTSVTAAGNTVQVVTCPTSSTCTPLVGVTKLSTAYNHTCAIANGKPYCWGSNNNGQLGLGTRQNQTSATLMLVSGGPNPVQVSSAQDIATGDGFSCYLQNGSVYCTGQNSNGSLGNGTTLSTTFPTLLTGP